MGKRSSEAHEGAVEKKILAFDPETLVVVTDENADLADDRANSQPPESLVLNVLALGVRQPITVRKNAETGKTEVVDGRMRTLACREANKRLKKRGEEPWRIPAVPARGTSGDLIGLMLTLNEQRVDDTPMNRAKKVQRMLERGKTEEEAGLMLGVSSTTVKNLLRLLDAPAAVRNAVDSGKIAASDGYKLAKLEPEEARKKVAQLIEHAPRTPGKKRSGGAAAKKRREIVDGGKAKSNGHAASDMRAENVVENVLRELKEKTPRDELIVGAMAALRWVLGDDTGLNPLGLDAKGLG